MRRDLFPQLKYSNIHLRCQQREINNGHMWITRITTVLTTLKLIMQDYMAISFIAIFDVRIGNLLVKTKDMFCEW